MFNETERLKKYIQSMNMGDVVCRPQVNYASGAKYEGQWLIGDTKRQGYGKFTYADGNVQEGMWYNDHEHGVAQYTWKSGQKFVGEFYKGAMNGCGTWYYKNGDKYVGELKNDKMHGHGLYFYADGKVFHYKFQDDKIVNTYSIVDYEKRTPSRSSR